MADPTVTTTAVTKQTLCSYATGGAFSSNSGTYTAVTTVTALSSVVLNKTVGMLLNFYKTTGGTGYAQLLIASTSLTEITTTSTTATNTIFQSAVQSQATGNVSLQVKTSDANNVNIGDSAANRSAIFSGDYCVPLVLTANPITPTLIPCRYSATSIDAIIVSDNGTLFETATLNGRGVVCAGASINTVTTFTVNDTGDFFQVAYQDLGYAAATKTALIFSFTGSVATWA